MKHEPNPTLEPKGLGPVETSAGDSYRLAAIRILNTRYQVLLERSKRRQLTGSERRELGGLGEAIEVLQRMEPAKLAAVA